MKRRVVQWLRDLYVGIAKKQYGGQPITLYIEPLDGSGPEDVFTGTLGGINVKPAGGRATFELVLVGPRHEGTGYQEIVRLDVREVKWNRSKRRWEAKNPSKPREEVSSTSSRARTSGRDRFSRFTMGDSSGMGMPHKPRRP